MADNGRLTVDQKMKVVLFYAETKSVVATQRRFRANFGTRWSPCKQAIYRLCQQFETNGSVLEKKRPRPASVRTPAHIEAVKTCVEKLWRMQGFVCKRLWGKTEVTLHMFFIKNNFPTCED